MADSSLLSDAMGMNKAKTAQADSARSPDGPTDLRAPTWKYTLKRAVAEFLGNQLQDRAAALTFYSVLSMFPALIVLVSLLGLLGQGEATTDAILGFVNQYVPEEAAEQLREPISSITENQGAGLGLVLGILTALWTASNYVNAFSRGMNEVYGMPEGRPIWKLRPAMYLLTALLIMLVGVAVLILVVSGPVARAVGNLVGLGDTAVMVWDIAKWPVLVLIVVVVLALLYYLTPNVKMPKLRWVSPGAVLAIVVAALATVGFGIYVANFGAYNATYGALAGVIIFLLWLWIMNMVILFGAALDAELERSRELQSGVRAEDRIQVTPRADQKIRKNEEKHADLVHEGAEIRRTAGDPDSSDASTGRAGGNPDTSGGHPDRSRS